MKPPVTKPEHNVVLEIEPENSKHLATLCGPLGKNLKLIEDRLQISIKNRGAQFLLAGDKTHLELAAKILEQLYSDVVDGNTLNLESVHLSLQEAGIEQLKDGSTVDHSKLDTIRTRKVSIKPRGGNQQEYVRRVRTNDINFGIGPAGTGKTYLAVACAVESLEQELIERILLVRPAVEAGEKLGFLPGDLSQKVDPYLRPLYDALYEMLGFEKVDKLLERNIIEVAPLAFMRGRTLNNSFIILDESQNTTREQMKMFLTRIGFGSTAVITGDVTQIDLPRGTPSGLKHAIEVLDGVEGISFTHFDVKDVVRHPLVQRIVKAYDKFEHQDRKDQTSK